MGYRRDVDTVLYSRYCDFLVLFVWEVSDSWVTVSGMDVAKLELKQFLVIIRSKPSLTLTGIQWCLIFKSLFVRLSGQHFNLNPTTSQSLNLTIPLIKSVIELSITSTHRSLIQPAPQTRSRSTSRSSFSNRCSDSKISLLSTYSHWHGYLKHISSSTNQSESRLSSQPNPPTGIIKLSPQGHQVVVEEPITICFHYLTSQSSSPRHQSPFPKPSSPCQAFHLIWSDPRLILPSHYKRQFLSLSPHMASLSTF